MDAVHSQNFAHVVSSHAVNSQTFSDVVDPERFFGGVDSQTFSDALNFFWMRLTPKLVLMWLTLKLVLMWLTQTFLDVVDSNFFGCG